MVGDGLAQLDQAVVGGVVGLALGDGVEGGFGEALRSDEVGLPHAQRDDTLHVGYELEEAADA